MAFGFSTAAVPLLAKLFEGHNLELLPQDVCSVTYTHSPALVPVVYTAGTLLLPNPPARDRRLSPTPGPSTWATIRETGLVCPSELYTLAAALWQGPP